MPRSLALAALVFACGTAIAQDYEREKRWRDEVLPTLVVGEPVVLKTAAGREFLALFTESKPAKGALLIIHGVGVHPDHGVIGSLRVKLAERGWTTLSVQMPVLAVDAKAEDYYTKVFPEALERIGTAAAWLKAHSPARLAMVSHSMGSWMANEYLDAAPGAPVSAWVCIGLSGGFSWGRYLAKIPTLDVYGENDLPQVLSASWRRSIALRSMAGASRQEVIPGADNFYTGKEEALAQVVDAWLTQPLKH
jgi:pimeloyl-ACP methyl ester carboxylesterase